MPYDPLFNAFPAPHQSVAGKNHVETERSIWRKIASLWRPKGAVEPDLSTLSRFALRLVNKDTGAAYTADELIAHLISDGIFPALDANGNISVNGLAPRMVEEAQRATDIPVLNELVWVGGTGGCLCRGDGVKTVSQLEWLGTHRVAITEEAPFVAPFSNASRLEITSYLDLSNEDMEIRLEQLVDGTGAGFTKNVTVRVAGQSSYAFRIKGTYTSQFYDASGDSLGWNIGIVNNNGFGGWMSFEVFGDRLVVTTSSVDSTAIYS